MRRPNRSLRRLSQTPGRSYNLQDDLPPAPSAPTTRRITCQNKSTSCVRLWRSYSYRQKTSLSSAQFSPLMVNSSDGWKKKERKRSESRCPPLCSLLSTVTFNKNKQIKKSLREYFSSSVSVVSVGVGWYTARALCCERVNSCFSGLHSQVLWAR